MFNFYMRELKPRFSFREVVKSAIPSITNLYITDGSSEWYAFEGEGSGADITILGTGGESYYLAAQQGDSRDITVTDGAGNNWRFSVAQ